jgi:hypothetical protein
MLPSHLRLGPEYYHSIYNFNCNVACYMDNNVSELYEITEQVQSGQLACVWNKNVMKWKLLSFLLIL